MRRATAFFCSVSISSCRTFAYRAGLQSRFSRNVSGAQALPSLAISRDESMIYPVSHDTVLDSDEMNLAYGSAYRVAMTAAPYAFCAMLLLWILVRSRNLKRPSA